MGIKARIEQQFALRSYWWGSLFVLLLSVVIAWFVYDAGLSTFLKRPSTGHTAVAVGLVLMAALAFLYASHLRRQAIGASAKFHLWLLFLPVWVLAIGLVPAVSERNEQPLKKATNMLVGGLLLATVTVVALFFGLELIEKPRLSEAVKSALKKSDEYALYASEFENGARQLIADQKCDAEDFVENGGFTKSVSKQPRNVFFIYCGSFNIAGRYYFEPSSDQYFK